MSWWGTHPKMSRAEARAALPPGACRICVYAHRCFGHMPTACPRCMSVVSKWKNGAINPFWVALHKRSDTEG